MPFRTAFSVAAIALVVGCAAPPKQSAVDRGSAVPLGGTNSIIAGQTLRCNAGGPSSNLTFGADGTLSGQLLQSEVTGSWYAIDSQSVHTHVIAGAVSLRDNLRRRGNRWVGKTTTCSSS